MTSFSIPVAPWEAEDAVLAASIFATADRSAATAMIAAWLEQHAQVELDEIASLEMSVGAAVAVRARDGGMRFLKVWPGTVNVDELAAQLRLQSELAATGFPAPTVLTGPGALGPATAALMAFDRRGASTDVRIPGVRDAMARALARLVCDARRFLSLPDLPRRTLPTA